MGDIPYISYTATEVEARKFLAKHWPEGTIPVLIEPIVEHRLGIQIEVAKGLFRHIGVSGFLTNDASMIYVDEFEWANYEPRYRFTLAHEVAHVVLHERYYRRQRIRSVEDLKAFRESIMGSDLDRLEIQAMNFAGAILMPRASLEDEVARCKRDAGHRIGSGVLSSSRFWPAVSARIARRFNVSTEAAQNRLYLAGMSEPPRRSKS